MSAATCVNCGGQRCMACVLREIHGACTEDCPSCCLPPQPALDRISAEADEADARYAAQRERAERAEAAVAELERRMAAMRREHDEAVGELLDAIDFDERLSWDGFGFWMAVCRGKLCDECTRRFRP